MRFIVAAALLLASAAALSQPVDRDDFARGLLKLIESSKNGFQAVRAEVSSRDDKGNPFAWRSSVAIRGSKDVVIFDSFASITIGSFRDPDQGRNAYRETVKLVRAILPETQWKTESDSLARTGTGGERGVARFRRGRNLDPLVYVAYRASASGSGRLSVRVSNRNVQSSGGRAEED